VAVRVPAKSHEKTMHASAAMVVMWAAAITGVADITSQSPDRLMGDPVRHPLARACSACPG